MKNFYKIENPTNRATAFHDLNGQLRTIGPNGNMTHVLLDDVLAAAIARNSKLLCTKITAPTPFPPPQKTSSRIVGKPVLPPVKAGEPPASIVVNLHRPKPKPVSTPVLNPGTQAQLKEVALVVGGAECWADDLAKARALCVKLGLSYRYFIVNDHVGTFPGANLIGTSLHPGHKLKAWLKRREADKLPPLQEMWCHRHTEGQSTHNTSDWGGSVGLFAARVALLKGYTKVIVCGVPMSPDYGHFVRRSPWRSAKNFHHGWKNHVNEIRPYIRSMTGWTRDLLGEPTEEWLQCS